jgi:hypothetical protein
VTPRLTSIPRRTPQLTCLLVSMVLVAAGCASGSTRSPLASPTLPGNAALATGAPAIAVTGPTSLVENGSTGSGAGVVLAGSTGSAQPNVATVYPYPGYAGSPGLAPDHTIVVTGTGTAAMKADLSDRATAERSAIAAALAPPPPPPSPMRRLRPRLSQLQPASPSGASSPSVSRAHRAMPCR